MSNTGDLSAIARAAQPLTFDESDYAGLLYSIGDARIVLIGEASHGTHDFYRERAAITRLLITQKNFSAVAVEADWPDAYRVTRFVTGRSADATALDALADFERFPAWMWRNMDVLAFVEWLRAHNQKAGTSVGFYGLDLYSLYTSAQAVLAYLEKVDPDAAGRARYRYSCFDQFGEDTQAYGYAASFGMAESCENAALEQLVDLRRRALQLTSGDGQESREEFFSAEENAQVVRDAEYYYRSMFSGRVNSWNVRDRHMESTLERLARHLGDDSRIVVWAHNSHLGDARATEMGERGELNVGQLARQRWGDACFSIGFTTYGGEVTAASDWDAPAERKIVRPGLRGSYEALFHQTGLDNFLLPLRGQPQVLQALKEPRLERAIGVIYRPDTERLSHYFRCHLPDQFDAVIHLDRTRALVPLETNATWHAGEPAETYPSGL